MYRRQMQVFPPNFQGGGPVEVTEFLPRVDVAETAEEVIYIIEIPGAEQNTINVEISNGTLHVEGQIEIGMEASQLNYLYQERPAYQKYSRLLFIPSQVDGEKAQANIKNGILMIRFPKKTTGRRLQVNPLEDSPQQEQLQAKQTPPPPTSPQHQNPFHSTPGL